MDKNQKTIYFYRKVVYGITREYVKDPQDARTIESLTRQVSLTPEVRGLITQLTNNYIQWEEIIAP